MDKNRFDGFTRHLAQRENRRQAIKTLLAGGVGTAAVVLAGSGAEAKGKPVRADCCPMTSPTLCDLTCTNTTTDESNCGGCGTTCLSYQTCVNSVCTGSAPPCVEPTKDCPASSVECMVATCDAGFCGFGNAPLGTPVIDQTAGDCLQNVCDGNGGRTTMPANDLPPNTSACFSWYCGDGTAYKTYADPGVQCSGGVCNGIGDCVQCATASDCPGSDTDCQIRTCIDGTCDFEYVSARAPLMAQTAGDCQRALCDGSGNVIFESDDTDVPAPSGECVTAICMGGVPSEPPKAPGESCNDGFGVCDGAGSCVQCVSPDQCTTPANAQAICNTVHSCSYICNDGWGECNNSSGDGCETNLSTDMSNCGGCGAVCHINNGTGECVDGQCRVVSCNTGWANCNNNPSDGCETDVFNDWRNCNACGFECPILVAVPYCLQGWCVG